MEAHITAMLAVQQLFTDAARQQQASSAAALEHLRAVEASAQAAEEDAVSGPMFDRFDSAGPGGKKDGRITAEECVNFRRLPAAPSLCLLQRQRHTRPPPLPPRLEQVPRLH